MAKKPTIAAALRARMLEQRESIAWAGDPDLLLSAYDAAGGRIQHPLDRIQAVIAAARRSSLFKQRGYIRACDSSGLREVLHPVFVLAQPQAIPSEHQDPLGYRWVSKFDMRLPNDQVWGEWSGKVVPQGTVFHKDDAGYRPWFHSGVGRLSIECSELVREAAHDA